MFRSHPHQQMYDQCKQHMNQHVLLALADGQQIAGIVSHVDDQFVHIDVPDYGDHQMQDRQYGFGGYGYPGYGYPGYGYPGYGYPGYGSFGARRLILPLAALVAISTLGAWY